MLLTYELSIAHSETGFRTHVCVHLIKLSEWLTDSHTEGKRLICILDSYVFYVCRKKQLNTCQVMCHAVIVLLHFLWCTNSYLSSSFYANVCPIQPCVYVCASVWVCSLLIQGSGWSCCPRGRSLVKPTQFFHIHHCNCSCWPGCLRLGMQTYTLTNVCMRSHICDPGAIKSLSVITIQWCVVLLQFHFFSQ